jgi:uncharacterized protein with FMN-binding domain
MTCSSSVRCSRRTLWRVRRLCLGCVIAWAAMACPATPEEPQTQPAAGAEGGAAKRSPAEIDALIESVGKTPPPWWDSVPLKYPDTLDLAGTAPPAKGWAPQQDLGAYYWSVISPNPARWREGIRLLHHVLTVRKDDKQRLAETMNQLAECYHKYEQDWVRSAFWRRKAMAQGTRAFANLDLKQVPNGKFRASSIGFRGPVEVEVEVRDGKILSVNVTRQQEDAYFYHMANRQVPKRIVDKQSIKGVDAVTGATVSSNAIINAAAKALGSAARPAAQ